MQILYLFPRFLGLVFLLHKHDSSINKLVEIKAEDIMILEDIEGKLRTIKDVLNSAPKDLVTFSSKCISSNAKSDCNVKF